MGKFKVGDKARLNRARLNFKIGEIVEIIETDFADEKIPYRVRIENEMFWVRNEDLKKVKSKNQRIKALEKRVEALEKLAEEYFKVPVEPSTDDVEVIEFEEFKGNKYRKVDRLAQQGDVVVLTSHSFSSFEVNKPYSVLKDVTIKSDTDTHHKGYRYNVYEDGIRTPKTVDVYEYIVEDKQ